MLVGGAHVVRLRMNTGAVLVRFEAVQKAFVLEGLLVVHCTVGATIVGQLQEKWDFILSDAHISLFLCAVPVNTGSVYLCLSL